MAPDSILEHANLKYIFPGGACPQIPLPQHALHANLVQLAEPPLPRTGKITSGTCLWQYQYYIAKHFTHGILSTQLILQKLPDSLLPLFLRGGDGNKANSTGVENLITTLVLKQGHDSGGSIINKCIEGEKFTA